MMTILTRNVAFSNNNTSSASNTSAKLDRFDSNRLTLGINMWTI